MLTRAFQRDWAKSSLPKAFLLIVIVFVLLVNPATAQRDSLSVRIKASYFNNQWLRPGFSLGIEKSLKQKLKLRKSGKIHSRELLFKSNLGFFTQFRHSTSVFINGTIGYRFTRNSGFTFDPLHPGVGYLHAFVRGSTFQVDAQGKLTEQKFKSYPNVLLPYLTLVGFGYDFRPKCHWPVAISTSIDLFWQRPVNSKSRLNLALPVNISFFIR